MRPISLKGIARAVTTVSLALLCSSSVCARELTLLTPAAQDRATEEFLIALTSSKSVKEAGITFRQIRGDVLGPAGQAASRVLDGSVQLALLQAHQIPGYQSDDKGLTFTSLLSHPLIVKDSPQQFYVEDSVLGDVVKQELGAKGFVVLSFWNATSSSLLLKKPVRRYAELKGLKVSSPGAQAREMLQALGATSTTMVAGEVYTAIERGAVDGSEARVELNTPLLQTVKGGGLVSSFQHGQGFLVAHQASWIGLRQLERVAIQNAAADAMTRARQAVIRADADLSEVARANGLVFTTFSSLQGDQQPGRTVWLKRVGADGAAALGAFDEVIRQQRAPAPAASSAAGPNSSAAPAKIYFATNRNDEGGSDLSHRFGVDRSKTLSCGEVAYARDANRQFGVAHVGGISEAHAQTALGAAACVQLIRASARDNGGKLVVFVHGFRNSFDFAVRRAIAFAQDFGISTPVLVLSWPSLDQISGYVYDIGSVSYTRAFAKDLIEALLSESDVRSISILSHSMGGQIALQMLEFAKGSGKPFDSAVFVAPDVPRTNFVQGIDLYGASTRLATMYANEHDRALQLSVRANRQAPAGLGGKARLLKDGVETVDVSEADAQLFEINHSHGFDVPRVASDVSLVLRQHARASARNLPSATQNGVTYWLIGP